MGAFKKTVMLCLRNIVDKSFAHVYVYLPSIGENCLIIHSEINILLTKFVPFKLEGVS